MTAIVDAGFAVKTAQGEETPLAMQSLWLRGRVLTVGAVLLVRHVFRPQGSKPVEAVHCFGLPRDAAMRRFRITGENFSARSELKPRAEASECYERGISEGRLSALASAYRDGVVNLNVGNVRPGETVVVDLEIIAGVELHDDGYRFRFPFTLAPAYHARARFAETAPGEGEMELPDDEFGDVLLPRYRSAAAGLHEVGCDLRVIAPHKLEEIASPSHTLRLAPEQPGRMRVKLTGGVPDRDLVFDVKTRVGGTLRGKAHFSIVMPSVEFGAASGEAPRNVVFAVDRSGSMEGTPLEQAKKAVLACLGALGETDGFGLMVFDDAVETFRPTVERATVNNREQARQFLQKIGARGGTEVAQVFPAAARMLGAAGSAADVLLATDGQVAGTENVLRQALDSRVHVSPLGIGSASQDRFLTLLARETGGVSRFLTPQERVDVGALELFASLGRPVATGVKARVESGSITIEPAAEVRAGNPLVLFGQITGVAAKVEIGWQGGDRSIKVEAGSDGTGEALRLIEGARRITEFEARHGLEINAGPVARREASREERLLETLSREYGLASRAMSLVAVIERAGDVAGQLPKTEVVPVGMPQGTQWDAYFGQNFLNATVTGAFAPMAAAPPPMPAACVEPPQPRFRGSDPLAARWDFARLKKSLFSAKPSPPTPSPIPDSATDLLVDLAGRLESDGGLPGRNESARVAATLVFLLLLLQEGHSEMQGAFRRHVVRALKYLRRAERGAWADIANRLLARSGAPGDWQAAGRSYLDGNLEPGALLDSVKLLA